DQGRGRARDERPARSNSRPARNDSRPPQSDDRAGRAGADRPAQGERGRSNPRVEGMPVQDRSPAESQRSRRRGRGRAGRPEFDRRDPDGLGRWANRADDFD
ncbi:MAG: hypothetical protein ABL998_05555, partial [Planctomycetota bacterium]